MVEPFATGLDFLLEEDGTSLLASYTPGHGSVAVDEPEIRRALSEQGFGAVALFDDALAELAARLCEATQAFTLQIGGSRDAEATVHLAADKLTACLDIRPAVGSGRPATRAQIEQLLQDTGVVEGTLDQVIDRVVAGDATPADPDAAGWVIARGRAPTHGQDTRFEGLVPDAAERRPREQVNGLVDYRELGEIVTVAPGDPLVRRIPATPGEAGITVTGEGLPAKAGKDVDFSTEDPTVERDPQDSDVLLAKIAGRPVITPRGAKVEQVLGFDTVDLSSGNVDFQGTVVVRGNVSPGMRVQASGDIQVGGMVEAAKLQAGGNVEVRGGIIGHGQVRDASGQLRHETTVVRSEGHVTARFIENAYVESHDCVAVQGLVCHSEVIASIQVMAGSGGKGQIIGGLIRARKQVQAPVIGAPASVHTTIEVGYQADIRAQLKTLVERAAGQQCRLEEVVTALRQAGQSGADPDTGKALQHARLQLLEELEGMAAQKQALEATLLEAQQARVTVAREVHANVHVTIDGRSYHVKEERGGGVFALEGGEVIVR